MKKTIKYWVLTLTVFAFIFTACEKENAEDEVSNFEEEIIINMNELGNRTLVTDTDLLNSIKTLDIDVGIVSEGDFHLPDGTVQQRIFIGSDISFTRKELNKLIEAGSDPSKQYRTYNLVTGNNQTINIIGYTGGSQALSSKAQTALTRAVANYNNISNMTLQFNLTFGTNYQAADMVVYDNSVNTPGLS